MKNQIEMADCFDRICNIDPDPPNCQTCFGTGIGRFGDPDTSKCLCCGGSGVHPKSKLAKLDDEFYD